MRTPKQFEEWLNSDNIEDDSDKIGDETLVEEQENFTEKGSTLETSISVDGLSTTCTSCCLSKNIIESLKQRLKELELKLKNNDLTLENCSLKFQNKIQKINSERENEIKNLKQYFQHLIEENTKQLKAENDAYLKQKDAKINLLEEEIKNFHNQSDDLIKLQTNFNDLQLKFNEEKEKTNNLENELKKMQTINEDKIEEIKNNFQKLIDENVQKDGKINSLEVEIKKANDLTDKKIGDLLKINNLNSVFILSNNMVFIKIKNKWKEVSGEYICCENNCSKNNPIVHCIKGNGFGNKIDDENIKYINCLDGKGGYDKYFCFYAESSFTKTQNCFNYSLYYFEVKCKFEKKLNTGKTMIRICLKNLSTHNFNYCSPNDATIFSEKSGSIKVPTISFNDNDIFGYGLVYPPTNKINEFPYIFFTQNGKQIGKDILLKNNSDSHIPYVELRCCSIETNFGNNLEAKPFNYDISKHSIHKEFY
uniref:Uncharacterized protein n=1 Tax=Meloidogyne enterolobii TaxID=390850 RepID=A0A6V7XLE2_MELEN|nr:unnamed protein product [Meloidogyne enterolobii]